MAKSLFCKKCRMLISNGICACNRSRTVIGNKQYRIHYGHSKPLCAIPAIEPSLTTNWDIVTCQKCLKKR